MTAFLMSILFVVLSSMAFQSLATVPSNCDFHTTITSQYEEYYNIDDIGNNRSEMNIVNLTMNVQLQNMQEEIALLLSANNRSRQYPDYEKTYEIRVSNAYTVIYKETLRMFAHHSHTFNFFPQESFQLNIRITRKGIVTVTIDGLTKPILSVVDEHVPIDVHYISFGSRMNAYPITWYFNCRPTGTGTQKLSTLSKKPDKSDNNVQLEELDENKCPICPKPEKCEVIVRACTDNSQDLLMNDEEKQKYFFYFNVYLSKNAKTGKAIESLNGNNIN